MGRRSTFDPTGHRLRTRWSADGGGGRGGEEAYSNPVDALQEYVEVPLLGANETAFRPSVEEIRAADDAFRRLPVDAVTGVVDAQDLPATSVPEVCFIGSSNVGKSSLIKALVNERKGVKIWISKTPGRTTTLNFYHFGKLLSLVDMPGYGENMPENYVQSVENYLRTRKNLVRTFLLIDGAAGITDVDKIGIEMMEEFGKPYVTIMTKIDKASHHQVLRNLLGVKQYRNDKMPSAFEQVFLVSAHRGYGIALLQAFIMYVTGNANVSPRI